MEVTDKRHIQGGTQYDYLFPRAIGSIVTIKKHSELEDTIKFLPQAILKTLNQTKTFAHEFKNLSPYEACKKLWYFVYEHIKYRRDEKGKEQIQSPQYTWGVRAGDCDDYTVFIASTLLNLGIKTILRIAMYNEETGFQHIYPLAVLPNGEEIIMDCVAKRFNYEVPFIKKIDKLIHKKMELQFLNGLGHTQDKLGIDAADLLEGYDGDIGDLGRKAKNKSNGKLKERIKKTVSKVKDSKAFKVVKKGLHIANRLNPAAGLLRAGILIALKTNLFKIAERLRFAYLTPAQAQAKDFDMGKYNRLVGIKDKLANIFYRAGGLPENFKKNILTGKGNRNKEVPLSGLEAIDYVDYTWENNPSQILGYEVYNSEIGQVEGLGELGIATTAAVAAATTVLSAIAALLKSIGGLRKKKEGSETNENNGGENTSESKRESEEALVTNTNVSQSEANPAKDDSQPDRSSLITSVSAENKSNANPYITGKEGEQDSNSGTNSAASETTSDSAGTQDENAGEKIVGEQANSPLATSKEKEGLFTRVGNWAKANPVPAAGIGILVLAGLTYGASKLFSKGGDKKSSKRDGTSLAGIKRRNKNKKHHSHHITTYKLR